MSLKDFWTKKVNVKLSRAFFKTSIHLVGRVHPSVLSLPNCGKAGVNETMILRQIYFNFPPNFDHILTYKKIEKLAKNSCQTKNESKFIRLIFHHVYFSVELRAFYHPNILVDSIFRSVILCASPKRVSRGGSPSSSSVLGNHHKKRPRLLTPRTCMCLCSPCF